MKQDRILELFFRGLRGEDISVKNLASACFIQSIVVYIHLAKRKAQLFILLLHL